MPNSAERAQRRLRRLPALAAAGRALPLAGDGQIDFKGIFSKLTEYDFDGWAVLEWECCLKDGETGRAKAASLSAAISFRLPGGRLMISPQGQP
jgi:sugar phosphate isomerase/epimerase